jgi:hypothetical protein
MEPPTQETPAEVRELFTEVDDPEVAQILEERAALDTKVILTPHVRTLYISLEIYTHTKYTVGRRLSLYDFNVHA